MPLIQSPSKKAFQKNVKTEMESNPGKKDRAQNLAIAYSIQRKNRKKHAEGGVAETPEPIIQTIGKEKYLDEDEKKSEAEIGRDRESMFKMADGGGVMATDSKGNTYPPQKPAAPTSADQAVAGMQKAFKYSGGKILKEELPDEIDPRAGHESALDKMERSMKMNRKMMASGGFAEPEWDDAGTLGFPMMEQENDPDEYSKAGIINYADGGEVDDHYASEGTMPPHKYARGGMTAEEDREIIEPTSQRLGEEDALDDMEYPMSYHGAGQGEHEAGRSFAQENPSIADSIRREYMAKGGMSHRKMMASGGYANEEAVDKGLDQNAVEHTNYMYKLNRQLADNEQFSEMNALQDIDYNQDGEDGQDSRDIPMDRYDMVDEIRRKYARNRAT